MIVFDCETERAVLNPGEVPLNGIEYARGWTDYLGMGIACVCTYDVRTHESRVFTDSWLGALGPYLADAPTGSFNGQAFDIRLLAAHGIPVEQSRHYDAKQHLGATPAGHSGSLDSVLQATFGVGKSGDGAQVPIWWQLGHRGRVIDYCLRDAWLTARLCLHLIAGLPVRFCSREDMQHARASIRVEPPPPQGPYSEHRMMDMQQIHPRLVDPVPEPELTLSVRERIEQLRKDRS